MNKENISRSLEQKYIDGVNIPEKDIQLLLFINTHWYRWFNHGKPFRKGRSTTTFKQYLRTKNLGRLVEYIESKEGY